ncbi:uncharacterized protein LOC144359614 [Saccoglossus kowalevskii]
MGYIRSAIVTLFLAVVLATYLGREDPYHPYEHKGPYLTPGWGTSHRFSTDRGYELHLYGLLKSGSSAAKVNFLLIHGTSHHAGWYAEFAPILSSSADANVFGLDLHGHGLSGGVRGSFDFDNFLFDCEDAARFIQKQTGSKIPIVITGFSQGGETVFQALQKHDIFAGAVSMNIFLPSEVNMNKVIGLIKSPIGALLEILFQDWIKIPLKKVIDFKSVTNYHRDPTPYEHRMRNPLMVWYYGFKSYRTVWNYKPPTPPSANKKPVLVTCGQKDTVVPASFCEVCYNLIGGPKDFYIIPGVGHQPIIDAPHHFAETLSSWVDKRVIQKNVVGSWTPPKIST